MKSNKISMQGDLILHGSDLYQLYVKKIVFAAIIIILWLAASFKLFGHDNDFQSYLELIRQPERIKINVIEPWFLIILRINAWLFNSNPLFVFLVATGISLFLKMTVFQSLSKYPFYCLFLYICGYYLLHDYTQIRVAISGAIFLSSVKDIYQNRVMAFLVKCVIAMMFHYMSLIMMVAFIFVKLFPLRMFVALPFLGLFFNLLAVDVFRLILGFFDVSGGVHAIISFRAGPVEDLNPFNLVMLGYYLLFIGCVIFLPFRKLSSVDVVLFKMYSFSLFFYLIFSISNLPVFVIRIFEFLALPSVILFSNIPVYFKNKILFFFLPSMFYLLLFYHFLANVWL